MNKDHLSKELGLHPVHISRMFAKYFQVRLWYHTFRVPQTVRMLILFYFIKFYLFTFAA